MSAVEGKGTKIARVTFVYPIVTLAALVMLFPLLWTLSTSLKTLENVTMRELRLVPDPVAWWNYVELFEIVPVSLYLRNTMVVVVPAILGGLLVCSLAAYAFARISFPGRAALFAFLLSTMMLPGMVRLVPLFIVFDRLGWSNSFLPLVVPRLLGHNPFYIFLLIQFFRGIPEELLDAARLDGCSEVGTWWRIVMPNSKPVLAAVAIFAFQFAWNDFLHPLIYLGGNRDLWTLALGLNALKGFEGMQTSFHYMMAMSVLMTAPMLAVFAVGQKYMVQGVTLSGVQG